MWVKVVGYVGAQLRRSGMRFLVQYPPLASPPERGGLILLIEYGLLSYKKCHFNEKSILKLHQYIIIITELFPSLEGLGVGLSLL